MKLRLILILVVAVALSACTQYSCPTYGNHYVYTPSKHKASRSSGKKAKPVKRAEQ